MSDWINIEPVEHFGPGQARLVDLGDVQIAVFNLEVIIMPSKIIAAMIIPPCWVARQHLISYWTVIKSFVLVTEPVFVLKQARP